MFFYVHIVFINFWSLVLVFLILIILVLQVKLNENDTFTFTFTFMHLADAFIQSDLQCIQAIHFLSLCDTFRFGN